ncbi:MAG: Ger(x)C family spore germination C-terminal domain-containing protein [Eubacteriales bacterium]|jgi:spore germination protein KC|nr:Ger(x)C family spore germination C-terminal domain-containing protein [Eubacteriales bacterium]
MKRGKYALILPVLCLTFFLTGCRKYIIGNVELSDITFPSAVSLDFSEENKENIVMAIESKKSMQSEQESSSEESYQVLKAEGRDVFEASRLLTTYSLKDINWGQNDSLILGEEIAKSDVRSYIDFFARNHENRGTVSVWVVKGARGESVIEAFKSSKDYVSDKIQSLCEDVGAMSVFEEINLYEFLSKVQNSYGGAVLPAIEISGLSAGQFNKSLMEKEIQPEGKEKKQDEKQEGGQEGSQEEEKQEGEQEDSKEEEEKQGSGQQEGSQGGGEGSESKESQAPQSMIVVTGYGVFKDGRLIGFLDAKMARALNWVNNKIISTEIIAYDKQNEKIALEVISSVTKVKAKIEDGKPSIKISISVDANVAGYYGQEDILAKDNLKALENQVSDMISRQVNAVIDYAKALEVDILDFNGKLRRQNPVKWEKIKNDWDKIFPTIDTQLKVSTRVSTTYNMKDSLKNKERKEK